MHVETQHTSAYVRRTIKRLREKKKEEEWPLYERDVYTNKQNMLYIDTSGVANGKGISIRQLKEDELREDEC
jgi:hypothetical protein